MLYRDCMLGGAAPSGAGVYIWASYMEGGNQISLGVAYTHLSDLQLQSNTYFKFLFCVPRHHRQDLY